MLVIMGKTASGKDSVVNKLINEHGYKRIVTYTTRPMRDNEIGVTYHFISQSEFVEKTKSGFFAEYRMYSTVDGVWYYGSAKEDYLNADDKTVVILTPDGYENIISAIGYKPSLIYLYANNETIRVRLKKRGDKKEEAERRIIADNADFKGVEMLADKLIYNNINDDIDDVVNKILEFMKK